MDNLIKRCMTIVAKASDDGRRIISFVGSTADRDRDDEVIMPKGWQFKQYKNNPVFLWGHDHSMPPVGKAVKVKATEDALTFDVEFPTKETYEFADTIYKLYKEGYLNAVSVGFMALEYKDGDPEKKEPRRTYTKQELLELSGVTVPSNMNALVSARGAGAITECEFVKMKEFMAEDHSKELTEAIAKEPHFWIEAINDEEQPIDRLAEKLRDMNALLDTILPKFEKLQEFKRLLQDEPQCDPSKQGEEPTAGDKGTDGGESYLSELFDDARKINESNNDINELYNEALKLKG